jgi:hypothetical protein
MALKGHCTYCDIIYTGLCESGPNYLRCPDCYDKPIKSNDTLHKIWFWIKKEIFCL